MLPGSDGRSNSCPDAHTDIPTNGIAVFVSDRASDAFTNAIAFSGTFVEPIDRANVAAHSLADVEPDWSTVPFSNAAAIDSADTESDVVPFAIPDAEPDSAAKRFAESSAHVVPDAYSFARAIVCPHVSADVLSHNCAVVDSNSPSKPASDICARKYCVTRSAFACSSASC